MIGPFVMEGTVMVESKPAAPKSDPKPAEKSEAATGGGLREELQAHHEARTTVPGRPGVDARLDNRSVEALEPPVQYGPDDPKPQSVSGPDVAGQAAHTREVLAKRKKS